MIPIKTHIPPNLSLESRQKQQSVNSGWPRAEWTRADPCILPSSALVPVFVDNIDDYDYMTREDLILVVNILRSDCDRLRRELDDAKGVIR